MRDFDEARREREQADRSFTIGGQQFVFRAAVAPEAIMAWTEYGNRGNKEKAALAAASARLAAAEAHLAALSTPQQGASPSPEQVAALAEQQGIGPTRIAELAAAAATAQEAVEATVRPEAEWLSLIDSTVVAIIEPDYAETWAAVRDPNLPHPLSLGDLQELLEWLVEQVVGRPTGRPSDSSAGLDANGTVSTVVSSSPETPTEPVVST